MRNAECLSLRRLACLSLIVYPHLYKNLEFALCGTVLPFWAEGALAVDENQTLTSLVILDMQRIGQIPVRSPTQSTLEGVCLDFIVVALTDVGGCGR